MPSQYDKLGSLLNKALKDENIPQYEQYKSQNNKKDVEKKIHSVNKIIHYLKFFNINHENFSLENLKQEYHSLLKEYHPDSNKDYINKQNISSAKIQEIKDSYKKIIEWYKSEGYKYFN